MQIYDSLKDLINPEMINKASALLGEKESNVSKAVSSIMASLLGVMLKKGDTPQIRNILDEAGNLNILSDIRNICEEKPTKEQQKIGDDFLQHLLGDKAADFTAPVANHANITKVATNRLVSMVAPIVAGYLGNKLVKDKMSMSQLISELNRQKGDYEKNIPSGLIQSFGLGTVLRSNTTTTASAKPADKPKKNRSWIIWLVLILLLLFIFLWWRSCRNTTTTETVYYETQPATVTAPDPNANTTTQRQSVEIALPNGVKLQAYQGGIEDQIIRFLQSDEYRNATEDQLRNRWFQFDNIAFEFGSSTQLMSGSQVQVNNLIEILKYFPNAKIKIGGFADKVGSEEVNMEISRERARTVESMLEQGGVGNQVVRIEGYGDEYANYSANAPESQRVKDREIALRFVK